MKATALLLAVCGSLWCVPASAADEEEPRQETLGPLERYDPNPRELSNLVAVFGDPGLGLPAKHDDVVFRLGDKDQWFVKLRYSSVAVMELDRETCEMRTKEIIKPVDLFSISSDLKYLFGGRQNSKADRIWECFDMTDNRSLWAVGKLTYVADAAFSQDSKELIVLHGVGRFPQNLPCVVSWYDAATGRRLRQVKLPGTFDPFFFSVYRNLLAVTAGDLYVARPSETDPGFFVIPDGAAEATRLDLKDVGLAETPQVRVGGPRRDILAFYNNSEVRLYWKDGTRLVSLGGLTTPRPRYGFGDFHNSVRFAPDGLTLVVGRRGQTAVVPITHSGIGELKIHNEGTHSTDLTTDGKFYLHFDDGGARVFDGKTFTRMNAAHLREHPVHCCPITEAGFSQSGKLIVSSDENHLLLWSSDGKPLAEMVSGREADGVYLKMQSALIDEKRGKIYGADGWDFLEWSLGEIYQRLGRQPLNVPRIQGKVIFNDAVRTNREAEVMNITFDAGGEHLITATRSKVRYRSIETPQESTLLPVPKNDIMFIPRSFVFTGTSQNAHLLISSRIYELDLEGKKEATLLTESFTGLDEKSGTMFGVSRQGTNQFIFSSKLGSTLRPQNPENGRMKAPDAWRLDPQAWFVVGDKGTPLVVRTGLRKTGISAVAVIDWPGKKVLWQQELPWAPECIALSADEKRLVVGSRNRAIYIFDFEKILQTPGADK